MQLTSTIRLKPIAWWQSVEHYTRTGVEGRRFSANCRIDGSNLQLSNAIPIETLKVGIQIFETTRMQDQLSKLAERSIGVISFYDAVPARAGFEALNACLAGWIVLNVQSFDDAWEQVLHEGYRDCFLVIEIGPLENNSAARILWDVGRNPHLNIETVALSFSRAAPTADPGEDKSRSSFGRR